VDSFAFRPIYSQGTRPRYTLNRSFCRPYSRTGRFGEGTNLLPVRNIEQLLHGCQLLQPRNKI
jgi:hypothetical protein